MFPAISYMYTGLPVCMCLCLIIGNLLVKSVSRSSYCIYGVTWANTVDHCLLSLSHSLGCWGDEWPQLAIHISWSHLWTQGWYPGAVTPPPRRLGGIHYSYRTCECGLILYYYLLVWAVGLVHHELITSRHHKWVCGGVIGCRQTSKGLQCQHACLMTFWLINICGCNRRSGLWILVFFSIMSVYSWKWHPCFPVE